MSNTRREYDKPFNESWAYPNVLKAELKAASYDIQPFPGTFRSGRSKWMATFMNGDRKVIARRIGMEMTSKKTGQPYKMFSRDEWVDREAVGEPPHPRVVGRSPTTPPRTILRREQTSDYTLLSAEDVLP